MFDTTYYKQVIDIKPAVNGLIQQSSPFSKFCRCHVDSQRAKEFFSDSPRYDRESVSILQIMMLGAEYMLVEYVLKADLEKKEDL